MLKKTITYTDYNDMERTEDFYFNLSTAELMELKLTTPDGYDGYMQNIVNAQNNQLLIKIMKDLIIQAYGEKTLDGKQFVKVGPSGNKLSTDFVQTEAFSKMFMELVTDSDAASSFVMGIMPKDLQEKVATLEKEKLITATGNLPVVVQ